MGRKITTKTGFNLGGVLNTLSKNGTFAGFLSDDSISNIDEFIDTGSYALNAIISGGVNRGIPRGRVVGLAGPSGCGKSLLCCNIVGFAQKTGYTVYYIDTENAITDVMIENMGGDPGNVIKINDTIIESVQTTIANILKAVIDFNKEVDDYNEKNEDKREYEKCLIIIDSLGNLMTEKEMENSISGNVASDMGLRAKQLGSMLRVTTNLAAQAKSTVVFSNHIYGNPGQMYPSLIQSQSGGMKPLYLASVIVQLSQTLTKLSDDKASEHSAVSQKTTGRNLRALTVKNRFVISELETNIKLNYKTGLDRYSGLLDLAIAVGYIERTGATCVLVKKRDEEGKAIETEKLGFASQFDKPEFWDAHLENLDKLIISATALSKKAPSIPENPTKVEQ